MPRMFQNVGKSSGVSDPCRMSYVSKTKALSFFEFGAKQPSASKKDNLMIISIEGPPLSKFDFHEACQVPGGGEGYSLIRA